MIIIFNFITRTDSLPAQINKKSKANLVQNDIDNLKDTGCHVQGEGGRKWTK